MPAFCLQNSLSNILPTQVKEQADEIFRTDDMFNDKKKSLIVDLLQENKVFDQLYTQKVTQDRLDYINSEICSLYIGGKWFHNMSKKKYHKEYKTKKDAFNSYYRTVTEFKAD